MRNTLSTLLIAATAFSAIAGGPVTVAEFQLGDHVDGNQSPPPYGLRLDDVFGSGVGTLSIGFHNDTVLTVVDNAGDLSINISGTLYGGLVDGLGGYVDAHSYAVDFTYAANVAASGNGWDVNGFDASNTGTLTNLDDNSVITLFGKPNTAGLNFAFLDDGHRLSQDNTTWVGRGWLTLESDGSDPLTGDRDWLFTATEIPAPGSLAMLGMGGLVATRRRR